MSTPTSSTDFLGLFPSALPTRRTAIGNISQFDPKERFGLRYQANIPWNAIHWTFFAITTALVVGILGAAVWRNYYYEDANQLQRFDLTRFKRYQQEVAQEQNPGRGRGRKGRKGRGEC